MATFPFSLITPEGKLFQGEVESVIAPGALGSFGVLVRHAPIISALKQGVLQIKTPERELFFAIDSGVFEMNKEGHAVAIIDIAVPSQSYQEAKTHSIQHT